MSAYTEAVESKVKEIENCIKVQEVLGLLTELSGLSDKAYINAYGSDSIWINVYNRNDLTVAMSCAPGPWTKSTSGESMIYRNSLNGISLVIYAKESALPPTCKIVEETIHYPAREAYTQTITKITCDV